jgi:HTH-type transcriptional regulator/antitoxin HigA
MATHNIANKGEYNAALATVDALMKKGEDNLKSAELKQLRSLAEAVEEYEDTYLPLPKADTIPELIELKMFEMKINQVQLADILEIRTPKLSQIMNGRREPDVQLLVALHSKMRIDANLLLDIISVPHHGSSSGNTHISATAITGAGVAKIVQDNRKANSTGSKRKVNA